jgi:hypothetical protein
MAKVTVEEFLANRAWVAIRIASSDLLGFFRKSFLIPLNTTGLALFGDGTCGLFREGQEVSGKFDLVLAKNGEIQLRMIFPDLRTADGVPISSTCSVSVEIATTRADLFRDFCRGLFTFAGAYGTSDLKNHIAPELRRVLGEHAADRPAAELHRLDQAGALANPLRHGLERFLFDAGVRYGRLLELSFVSADVDQRAAAEAKRAEEQRRSAALFEKKEERLKRLAGILKDQEVQGLLTRVPDERLKGLLYAKLMEDDALQVTAEDLISRVKDCGEEVVQVIYKAMEGLLSTGASVGADEIESLNADRIFAAAGNRVLEVDPADPEAPRVHAFREPLRSVRYAETARGALVAGGSKKAVHAIALGEAAEILEYPLPNGRPVKGGINSIALDGRRIYATHSEYGLARWSADRPGEIGELLFEDVTGPHKTTRAVQIAEGRLVFASGSHVFSVPPEGSEPVKYVSSIESPVTCVAAAARTLFAGTESGSIVCWKMDAPDQPVVLVRKRDPIVNLRLAKICAIPHLLYSTRDLSVRARVIGQNLETSYESGGATVGVLDAASDLICASDADGRRLLLWKSTAPSRPSREIDLRKLAEKPILDLWMKKVRPRSAAS